MILRFIKYLFGYTETINETPVEHIQVDAEVKPKRKYTKRKPAEAGLSEVQPVKKRRGRPPKAA